MAPTQEQHEGEESQGQTKPESDLAEGPRSHIDLLNPQLGQEETPPLAGLPLRPALEDPSDKGGLVLHVVVEECSGPEVSPVVSPSLQTAHESQAGNALQPANSAGSGIKENPAVIGKVHLDPGVGISLTYEPVVADRIPQPTGKPVDDAGGDALSTQEDRHGRGVVLAVPLFHLIEEGEQRVWVGRSDLIQTVGKVVPQPLLNEENLIDRVLCTLGPAPSDRGKTR